LAEEKAAMKVKYDHRQRLIREIAANQLLQEKLAKRDPNLVTAAFFLSKVCGTDRGLQRIKEITKNVAKKGTTDSEIAVSTVATSFQTAECIVGEVTTVRGAVVTQIDGRVMLQSTETSRAGGQTQVAATMERETVVNLANVEVSVEVERIILDEDESDAMSIGDTIWFGEGLLRNSSRSHRCVRQ